MSNDIPHDQAVIIARAQGARHMRLSREVASNLEQHPYYAIVLNRVERLFLSGTPELMAEARKLGEEAIARAEEFLSRHAPELASNVCATSAVASACQMIAATGLDRSDDAAELLTVVGSES